MRMMTEARRLIKVHVRYEKDLWTLQYEGTVRVFHGDVDSFAKFLQRIRACDDATQPRSVRNKTYMNMALEIQDGSDPNIWIWSTVLSKMQDFHLE
jgi:hypothetical protein